LLWRWRNKQTSSIGYGVDFLTNVSVVTLILDHRPYHFYKRLELFFCHFRLLLPDFVADRRDKPAVFTRSELFDKVPPVRPGEWRAVLAPSLVYDVANGLF
jgi:hypothetical protein